MNTEYQIIRYLNEHLEATVSEMVNTIGVSKQMLHRTLIKLQEKGEVRKIGRAPKVYYKLIKSVASTTDFEISTEDKMMLAENFNRFTMFGEKLEGWVAFKDWCDNQRLPYQKTINEFKVTIEKYKIFRQINGLIDGTQKIIHTKGFEKICVDQVFYGDFYAIERFGKTRLGNLVHFAKQGQNKSLISTICDQIKPSIMAFIEVNEIDAVVYIPPTIKRDVQFMSVLQQKLNFSLPHIKMDKISGQIPIPQKALSKISDRISNAAESIVVADKSKYKNVLMIDDAVGSGATINETACKLKIKQVAQRVFAYAVVGSYEGFEVIHEV